MVDARGGKINSQSKLKKAPKRIRCFGCKKSLEKNPERIKDGSRWWHEECEEKYYQEKERSKSAEKL